MNNNRGTISRRVAFVQQKHNRSIQAGESVDCALDMGMRTLLLYTICCPGLPRLCSSLTLATMMSLSNTSSKCYAVVRVGRASNENETARPARERKKKLGSDRGTSNITEPLDHAENDNST
jgi:hypothetical protein